MGVVEVAFDIMQPVADPLSVIMGHVGGCSLQGGARLGSKTLIGQFSPRHGDQRETLWKQTRCPEIAKRRQQQARSKISPAAKDDEKTRIRGAVHGLGSTWPPKLWRIAERSLSATSSFSRERKRAKSDAAKMVAGTP